jgi:phage-related protein
MKSRGERIIRWTAGSREALREMPERVRWLFERALNQAEIGCQPKIASALRGQLQGVLELRADHEGDTFRLYYTLKCPGLVYVLYCHKKKSKRGSSIPKHEKDLIAIRYGDSLLDCVENVGGVR